MKEYLHFLAASLSVVAVGGACPAVYGQSAQQSAVYGQSAQQAAVHGGAVASRLSSANEAFKFAPKSTYELANGGKALSLENVKAAKAQKAKAGQGGVRKVVSNADLTKLPSGYMTGYLDAPDGSTWFYTQDLEYTEVELEGGYATKKSITKYTFTIYNSNYEEVGTISDDLVLGDNETGVSAIELGAAVTQKFFNSDSNYEVMVMIAANTPEYVNHVYTKVYSIGVEGAIDTIEGYYINAVNSGTYSEKFYVTFFQDKYLTGEEYKEATTARAKAVAKAEDDGVELDADDEYYVYHYDIYGPASWSNPNASLLQTFTVNYDNLEGYDATPFIGVSYNGSAYFAVMQYEKPYFMNSAIIIDQSTGEMSRDLTPNTDNSLVVNLYKTSYSGLSLESTTSIPMELKDLTGTTCSFYEIGLMDYNNDVSFGTWTNDGKPTYVVAVEDYVSNTDESVYSFSAYDVNGNKVADIASEAEGLVDASDLPGFEHQQGFYKTVDGVESFQYVNIPSCRIAATFPVYLDNGNNITSSSDRVVSGNSYKYAFSLAYADTDDDDNTTHYIAWYNADGSLDQIEEIPLGKQVAQALPYVKTAALSPYLFNTDSKREYMFLLKNYTGVSTTTEESLVILNTDGDVIAKITGDDEMGALLGINLFTGGENPVLWIIYYNDDNDLYTSTFLQLPFTKFDKGGDGSASNPFLISTVGDLQLMKGNLTANYKLANDIDADGFDFQPVGEVFKGTLDGDGHTIKNLTLINDSYYNGLFQQISGKAEVKNIKFSNVNVVVGSSNSSVALIAASASGDETGSPSISNIHVNGYTALADGAVSAQFGGLVGKMSISASLKDCSISGAAFDLGEDGGSVSAIGGLATQIMTGSYIENCSFDGWIDGGANIGGILAKLTVTGISSTGQEHVTNCHVNAEISGKNTIGGIVGYSGRAPISNNYVEGSLVATQNETWGGGAKTAGIVGELAEDWNGTSTQVIYNNVVAVSSITIPEYGEQDYMNQATTSHRVVGYTSYNAEPNITGYDSSWNPIYSDEPNDADAGLQNNYVVGDLAVVDSSIEAGAATTEGATLSADELTQDFLANIGYVFGESASAPWVLTDTGLQLYFEAANSGVSNIKVANSNLSTNGNAFVADGCKITVYNLSGVKVASANNKVSTLTLVPGVYIVSASKDGRVVATSKYVVK